MREWLQGRWVRTSAEPKLKGLENNMKTAKYGIIENVELVKARRFGGGNTGGERGSNYPVAQLKVGQAFFVPLEEADEENNYVHTAEIKDAEGNGTGNYELMTLTGLTRKIQGSVSRLAKQHNFKLAVRALPASEDPSVNPWGEAGVGVWRVVGVYGKDDMAEAA